MKHSNYLLAKCFAAYFGSAIYKDHTHTGISGNIIDSVMRFGNDGWRIKLMRPGNIQPDHAQRILEIRTGEQFEGCFIECINIPEGYVIINAIKENECTNTCKLPYKNRSAISDAERQYLIGEGYDMGFSYIESLIDDGIGIDIADLQEPQKYWNKSRVERGVKDEVIANLKYCSNLAISTGSPAHIGLINFLIATFELNKANEMFMAIGPVLLQLKEDTDKGFQAANN